MPRVHRVDPSSTPGIRRVRSRGRFRYLAPDGHAVDAATRERIGTLVIPPAWRRVWICPDPLGHIQAVGVDDAGRRQYLYHPAWRTRRDAAKFDRALQLARALPTARASVTRALRSHDDEQRVLAVAFRLLDRTAVRMGSPQYLRQHGSRGLITLRWADTSVEGETIRLAFTGKMQQRHEVAFDDAELAEWITGHTARPTRAFVLRYRDGVRMRAITAGAVNDFICACTHDAFTAKDFRTLRGTVTAAATLAAYADEDVADRERRAVDATAQALGNTRAVARASYIDPRVFRAARAGRFVDPRLSPEKGVLRLLDAR